MFGKSNVEKLDLSQKLEKADMNAGDDYLLGENFLDDMLLNEELTENVD